MVSLWQILGVRMAVGWLLVSLLPMGIFWDHILAGYFLITQVNSLIVSSFGIVGVIVVLDKFTRLLIQKTLVIVLPTYFAMVGMVAALLLIFRIPYSVYYLVLSMGFGLIFCFVSQFVLNKYLRPTLAYVPVGRCRQLLHIKEVNWIKIDDKSRLDKCSAVVADLSDEQLKGDWERYLAKTVLRGIPVYNYLQVQEFLTGRIPIHHLHENNLGSLLPSPYYLMFKRLVDSLIILISLPIVLPLALLVVFGIWCDDKKNNAKASVIFTQERIGQGAKPFKMYKFRSMIPSSETQGAKMATANDKRITQFGRFIRKTRLDELPQFINVLKGEMSLIGPRPEQPSFVAQFNESIPFYAYRHIVRPGISGWAQVMHGYASDEDETKVKLEHDFYYIKNFSPTLDLLIVIKTIQTMLTGFGAR